MSKQDNSMLIITRGIPASGKTTWARAWVDEEPTRRTRINRDDIRAMMFAKPMLDYIGEQHVTAVQQAAAEAALRAGLSVVIDDTNLRLKYAKRWQALARRVGADFAVKDFFDVSLDVCIERDAVRGARGERSVGEEVVRDFYARYIRVGIEPLPPLDQKEVRQYEPDTEKPLAWIVDIDGTLAHMNARGPFEWHRVGEDLLDTNVASLTALLAGQLSIIVVSALYVSIQNNPQFLVGTQTGHAHHRLQPLRVPR